MTQTRDRIRQDLVQELDARVKAAMTRTLKEVEKVCPTERSFGSVKKTIFDIFQEEFHPLIRELGNNATIPHKERYDEIHTTTPHP